MKKYLLVLLLAMTAWAGPQSGLNIGEACPAYHPQHVTGPDANTDTCPV